MSCAFFCFFSQSLSGEGVCKTRNCTDCSRRGFTNHGKAFSRIQPYLLCFFLLATTIENHLASETAAGDLHMSQPVSLLVSAYFINPCAELCVVFLRFRIPFKSVKEFLHTLVLKCRTEIYGEQLSFRNGGSDCSITEATVADTIIPQVLFHQLFVCHSRFIFIQAAVAACFHETVSEDIG